MMGKLKAPSLSLWLARLADQGLIYQIHCPFLAVLTMAYEYGHSSDTVKVSRAQMTLRKTLV
jgi:hypothetical protein